MPVRNIDAATLARLNTALNALFKNAFAEASPIWNQIASLVNSSTAIETYTWLQQIPGMKEWIGSRIIERLELEAYTLKNKKFEDTVAILREAIEDDTTGNYSMAIQAMAAAAAVHPDELVFAALAAGFTNPCYDGQNFFDADHPVRMGGIERSVSNFQGGTGTAWYLLATNRPVKPLIYQSRIAPELIVHDDPKVSTRVFMNDEFLYGTRSRGVAGYAFWQTAYASKEPLTHESFADARRQMLSIRGDGDRPLGIMPNLLVVPPSLETAADDITMAERRANGSTNTQRGKATVLMTPWLSDEAA